MRRKLPELLLLLSLGVYVTGDPLEEVNWELGVLMGQLVVQYFQKSRCIALTTSTPAPWLDYQKTLSLENTVPQLSILLRSQGTFRSQILPALDAACTIFVFQVSDPKFIIQEFYKITRYSPQNIPRQFIFLPTLENGTFFLSDTTQVNSYLKDLFSMREMDFMPDVLFIRVKTNSNTRNTVQMNDVYSDSVVDILQSFGHYEDEVLSPGSFINKANGRNNHVLRRQRHVFELEILTHSFGGSDSSKIIHLDTWIPSIGFSLGNNLFENKICDLKGKKLTAALVNYPPYVLIDWMVNPPVIKGSEIRCIQEFGRKFNATFKYMADKDFLWGKVYENGSAEGVFSFIIEGDADFGLGSFYYSYPITKYAEFAVPHSRSEAICLTPRPKLLSRLLTPLLPFTLKLWIAVALSVILLSVLLFVLQKAPNTGQRNANERRINKTVTGAFFTVMGMLVLQTPSVQQGNTAARHLMVWTALFYVMVSSLYSSGLAANMAISLYESPIETIEDLANGPFLWAADTSIWITPIQTDTNPAIQKVVDKLRMLPDQELEKLFKEGKTAFAAERTTGGIIILPRHLTDKSMKHLRAMKGHLYWGHMAIIMRKGSPYGPALSTLVLRLLQGGIPGLLERYIAIAAQSERMHIAYRQTTSAADYQQTVLTLYHLQGIFVILAIGLLLSFITFLIEHQCKVK